MDETKTVPNAEPNENQRILKKLWDSVYWVSFPFGILSFVLPIYGRELGASALEIGVFFAAFSVIPVIVRPFLGRALDRWGRRPFFVIGLLGYTLAMIMFSFSGTITMITIARLIQGLGAAFLWISAYTIVADIAKATGRGYDFGLIDEGANRGAIIGTFVGFGVFFYLMSQGAELRQTWFIVFACFVVPTAIGFWNGLRGVPETRPETVSKPIEGRPISSQLFALMAIVFITGASTAMVWPLLMIFLSDILNAEVNMLAIAYLPAALIGAFLPSRMGILTDRFGRKGPMIAGLLIGAVASALIPQLRSIIALSILWAVENLGFVTATPAQRAFVADIAGEELRGTNYGLYTFALFFGAVIGPLVGGWLYDEVGNSSPFYLNAIVLGIAALLVIVLLRETHPTSEEELIPD
ncbi:MAG: MFS transporter [Anaerolineales bacterium]|nr:MFS transporter [Anaerolineales bacterium]